MKSYGAELESEVFNKLRKSKDVEQAEKRREMELALQKKAELDQINAATLDRKKQMQSILQKDYENSIKLREQQKMSDRNNDLSNGRMANDKVAKELEFLNQTEANKKKMVKEILNNARHVHDGVVNQSEKDRYAKTLEDKRHLEEIERRNKERDLAQLTRYNQFNDFQNKISKSYNQQVVAPKIEQESQFRKNLKKAEEERNRKYDQDVELQKQMKKDWAMNTRFGQEKQMKSKNEENQARVAEHYADERNTRSIERDFNSLKNQDLMEKKQRQQKYKEMLDYQKKTKDSMNMYGNMTGIEKQMNKNELTAFKNYDNKTYAMIPGLNSTATQNLSNKVLNDKQKKTNFRTHEEEDHRMNQFGLTRDVTLIKNPALYGTNAHRSSMDDITGHAAAAPSSTRGPDPEISHMRSYSSTAPTKAPLKSLSATPSKNLNFNNHHLYQSYNPISGAYSPEKHNMNQARTTFRYAAARNVLPK